MLVYSSKTNPCREASIMCEKHGSTSVCVKNEIERRAVNIIEKAICQMAREHCKRYRRKKNEYRMKRMFKRK